MPCLSSILPNEPLIPLCQVHSTRWYCIKHIHLLAPGVNSIIMVAGSTQHRIGRTCYLPRVRERTNVGGQTLIVIPPCRPMYLPRPLCKVFPAMLMSSSSPSNGTRRSIHQRSLHSLSVIFPSSVNMQQPRPVYPRLSEKHPWSVVGKAHNLNTTSTYYPG